MFKVSPNKISLAASALLLCAGLAQATTPPGSPLTAGAGLCIDLFCPAQHRRFSGASDITVPTANGSDPFVVDPTTCLLVVHPEFGQHGYGSGRYGRAFAGLTLNFVASSAASALGVAHTPPRFTSRSMAIRTWLCRDSNGHQRYRRGSIRDERRYRGGERRNSAITWVYGSALPTINLTLLSSSYPISFTAVSAVAEVRRRLDPTQRRERHCV